MVPSGLCVIRPEPWWSITNAWCMLPASGVAFAVSGMTTPVSGSLTRLGQELGLLARAPAAPALWRCQVGDMAAAAMAMWSWSAAEDDIGSARGGGGGAGGGSQGDKGCSVGHSHWVGANAWLAALWGHMWVVI